MEIAFLSSRRAHRGATFLPVAFIAFITGLLYVVYVKFHCLPRLGRNDLYPQARLEFLVFNTACALLVVCYMKCLLTPPGTIPDDDPTWSMVPTSPDGVIAAAGMQEWKHTGERRACKWCAKLKPDRSHHCKTCHTCVLKMDHHCPWIYNCVGFKNYKYFFLLLVYTAICCHLIIWTMKASVKEALDPEVPFLDLFFLIFGEMLAGVLGFGMTVFLGFHIFLMLCAMTTVEYCEKSKARTFRWSTYDRGLIGNISAVLGDNPLLWFLPMSMPSGSGLQFLTEDMYLLRDAEQDKGYGGDFEAPVKARRVQSPDPSRVQSPDPMGVP